MSTGNSRQNYLRATRDEPTLGIRSGIRPEPSLDEARAELSEAISRVATSIFKDKYGPLLGIVSQPAVNEFLKGFEANVSRAKGDLTLVFEELLDRVVPKNLKNGK
jgi:hypothetical protein